MDSIFVEGLYLNKVSEKAPSFIITNQSIHVEKLSKWLEENKLRVDEKGYIKIVGLESKDKTKRYFKVDDWKPEKKEESKAPEYPEESINPEDVPF